MTLKYFAISALACALAAGTSSAVAQGGSAPQLGYWNGQQTQYQGGYGDGDADDGYRSNGHQGEYQRFQDRGYHDGYNGAFKDFQNHRNATPMNRDEYRRPDDVPREAMRAYRIAFRQGYLQGVQQLQANPYPGTR